VGAENTFSTDLFALGEARDALKPIIENVWHHCEATGTWGRTVTLKVKYASFQQITRSLTCDRPVATLAALAEVSYALLESVFPVQKGIRLLGVTLSSLSLALANFKHAHEARGMRNIGSFSTIS
jgi:DNA polymerase-4